MPGQSVPPFQFALVLREMLEEMGGSFSGYKYGNIERLPGPLGQRPFGDRKLGVTSWLVSSLETT